jgi:hypothetical protein
MSRADEIAEMKKKLAELEAAESPFDAIERQCEITVGIHTCDAMFRTHGGFWRVVQVLAIQGLPLEIITTDNMSLAGEGTVELLEGWRKSRYWQTSNQSPICGFRYLGKFPKQSNVELNVAFGKGKILEQVKTPFVFWLDQDVLIRPGDLPTLLEEFKAAEKIGALGIPYMPKTDHVQMGATLMETETARRIGFDGRGRCVCTNLAKALADEGLEMKHWSGGFARHISREV